MPTSYSNSNSHMQAPLEDNFNPPPLHERTNLQKDQGRRVWQLEQGSKYSYVTSLKYFTNTFVLVQLLSLAFLYSICGIDRFIVSRVEVTAFTVMLSKALNQ